MSSDDTVRRRIKGATAAAKDYVNEMLSDHDGKFSFTTDIWTSRTGVPFMVVTTHFIDASFQSQNHLIGFRYVSGSHTGGKIADLFLEVS